MLNRSLDRLAQVVVGHSLADREVEAEEIMDDPDCDL